MGPVQLCQPALLQDQAVGAKGPRRVPQGQDCRHAHHREDQRQLLAPVHLPLCQGDPLHEGQSQLSGLPGRQGSAHRHRSAGLSRRRKHGITIIIIITSPVAKVLDREGLLDVIVFFAAVNEFFYFFFTQSDMRPFIRDMRPFLKVHEPSVHLRHGFIRVRSMSASFQKKAQNEQMEEMVLFKWKTVMQFLMKMPMDSSLFGSSFGLQP